MHVQLNVFCTTLFEDGLRDSESELNKPALKMVTIRGIQFRSRTVLFVKKLTEEDPRI